LKTLVIKLNKKDFQWKCNNFWWQL